MKRRAAKRRRDRRQRAVAVFEKHGGILRTGEAIGAVIHPSTLYAMREAGKLARLSRGVYRPAERLALGNPDLVTVAKRMPQGVICLISALAFHDLTTQIPHVVHIALPRGARESRGPSGIIWENFSGPDVTHRDGQVR